MGWYLSRAAQGKNACEKSEIIFLNVFSTPREHRTLMKMKDNFWERIPSWILNAGWIGQGLLLALQQVHKFLMESAYAYLLIAGAAISMWGLWRKNRLQIRREEIALQREQQALEQDAVHAKEIQEIKKERERKSNQNNQ